MNEIAKKRIQEKLLKAMDEESLKSGQVAKFLNLNPCYISMMKNENHWEKCPRTTWEKVLAWVNSGESMAAYKEKPVKIVGKDIYEKEKVKEKVEETVKENVEITEFIEFTKSDASQLIGLLKTERLSLEKQINAIDTLLESYQLNNQ